MSECICDETQRTHVFYRHVTDWDAYGQHHVWGCPRQASERESALILEAQREIAEPLIEALEEMIPSDSTARVYDAPRAVIAAAKAKLGEGVKA